MRKVWKYKLDMEGFQSIFEIPEGGKVIHVDNQRGNPTLWVEVDPIKSNEKRTFTYFGTGHTIPVDNWKHVGSCIIEPYVWHVYEWIN
jgi:hypothetical protein